MAESSKKAAKRFLKNRQAIFAARRQNINRGIRISTEEQNSRIEGQSNTNTLNEQSGSQVSQANDNAKKAKQRGSTRMAKLKGKEPMEVDVNMHGQTVDGSSITLSSYMGTIVREHIPVTLPSWKQLDDQTKEMLWSSLLQYFKLLDCHKDYIFRKMDALWRLHKCRITRKIREANAKPQRKQELKSIKPKNITNDLEWKNFVKERTSTEFDAKSKQFRDMSLSQQFRHITGRRGYARLQHIMIKQAVDEGKDPSSVTRVDVWIRGHQRKEGKSVSDAVQNVLNEIEELRSSECPPNDDNVNEDTITRILGKEKRGQVRGLGFGATPSQIDAQVHSGQKMKALENEVASLKEMVVMVMKQNQELLNKCAMVDAMRSHDCTPSHGYTQVECMPSYEYTQSQHGSVPTTQSNFQLENAKCHILHWYPTEDEDKVVAEGRISSTDPSVTIHNMPLGRCHWRVWVDVVFEDIKLCRPTDEHETLSQAIGSTVAWIKECIKLV